MTAEVNVVLGAGSIGQAIVRRISAGKHILLADIREQNADAAAKTLIDAGFTVTTATVDVRLGAPFTILSRRPRHWARCAA